MSDSLKEIRNAMQKFFKDCGAVEWNQALEDEAKIHERNAANHRWFGRLIGPGSESFNFSRRPKKGINHDCVCDRNGKPK